MIWNTGSETYDGNLADQYANGSYTEVWFKEATVGSGTVPNITRIKDNIAWNISMYPNPAVSHVQIYSPDYSITSLQLFNLSGQCVNYRSHVSGSEIQLDLSDIESGGYLLVIENENKYKTISKLIKQ